MAIFRPEVRMRIALALLIASAALACSSGKSEGVATNVPPATTSPTETRSRSDIQLATNTVTGRLVVVERGMITLQGPSGDEKVTVDADTEVLRNGVPVAQGLDALREGEQVRASYDPRSRRAARLELQPTQGMPQGSQGSPPPKPPTSDPNTPPH
jgi:hypothetical protein